MRLRESIAEPFSFWGTMTTKVKKNGKPISKPCRDCSYYRGLKQKLKISAVLTRAIAKFEEKITETDFSPSVGDYIKLVQMKKELEEATNEAKEIKVTWVEPATSDSGE